MVFFFGVVWCGLLTLSCDNFATTVKLDRLREDHDENISNEGWNLPMNVSKEYGSERDLKKSASPSRCDCSAVLETFGGFLVLTVRLRGRDRFA